MRLAGCSALVTGASSGIGRAVAAVLADRGCGLLLVGRDEDRLTGVARATGGEALPADLADLADTQRLAETVTKRGVPDLVVLNAGVGLATAAADHTPEEVERVLTVNFHAPVLLTAALLPGMRSRGSGGLAFVGSIAGAVGVPGESVYAASKAALGTYAASLRGELARSGVTVTTVLPGVVDTPFFERRGEPYRRRFPRPMPADRVARALVRAVERGQPQVVVPGWLRVPIAINGIVPGVYARLSDRWA